MTPEERAELDRLLDLREREELMASAPTPEQDQQRFEQVQAELAELVSGLEAQHALVRARRDALAPDGEWLEED